MGKADAKLSYFVSQTRGTKTILQNLNFTVAPGQRLAVVGSNGAGKTTLLRLIAGSIQPSSGSLSVKGKTHALFNLQLGMHPKGTGRENILLRGLQLGMSMREIREKTDAAIEFTDLGENIDRIFASYSAGMKLRLAIAVTLMPNPDILVMDEWIGAGDRTFTKRLSDRLNEYVDDSSGLVIASHNVNLIKRICTHALLLDDGRQLAFGEVTEVLKLKQDIEIASRNEKNVLD